MFVFARDLWQTEQDIASALVSLSEGSCPWSAESAGKADISLTLGHGKSTRRHQLSPSQSSALDQLLNHKVCVLTGGPGVGKTKLLEVFANLIEEQGANVTLCAPTGRAAQRLSESTGRFACTIHRLLRASPGECSGFSCMSNLSSI